MEREFEVDEAAALIPLVREVEQEVIRLRAELVLRSQMAGRTGEGIADVKALEAALSEVLDRLTAEGIQIKGYAPLLVDFPHRRAGREILLCWLEGERELGWFHDAAHGFMGRRPLDEL